MEGGRLAENGNDQNAVTLLLVDDTIYGREGRLQFSDVTVDPTTGSINLRAVFANPDGVLLPGMFVRARVQEGVDEQAILVPQEGVSRDRKGNPLAMTVDADSKVQLNPLTLERAIGNKWLVWEGLKAGDSVIVSGQQMLRPGAVVKVVPEDMSHAKPENDEYQEGQRHERTDGGA